MWSEVSHPSRSLSKALQGHGGWGEAWRRWLRVLVLTLAAKASTPGALTEGEARDTIHEVRHQKALSLCLWES